MSVIEVSSKHKILRTVLFVAAFVLAVYAFTRGVLSIGHKDPGWQEISASVDNEAPLYHYGFTIQYYADGSSSQIREVVKQVTDIYSRSLARAYKLTDTQNLYSGYVNLATLNSSDGARVQLGQELFDILVKAYDLTLRNQGYNMFAGALYSEWNTILNSYDAVQFDPLVNDYQAYRIQRLAETVSDLSNFRFEIADYAERIVVFEVSENYKALMKELEISAPALDLNILRDAFVMEIVRSALVSEDLTNAQMSSDSGMAFSLVSGKSSAFLSATPVNSSDLGYYIVEAEGVQYLRHPYFDTRTGSFSNLVMQCSVLGAQDRLADVSYLAYLLMLCGSEAEIEEMSSAYAGTGLETNILLAL